MTPISAKSGVFTVNILMGTAIFKLEKVYVCVYVVSTFVAVSFGWLNEVYMYPPCMLSLK
jgi:hypothetical protein